MLTGHDSEGNSPASNTRLPDPHTKTTILWVTNAAPAVFTGEQDGATIESGFAPPQQESRFGILEIVPGNRLFMHRTDSIDYVVCLEGTVQLLLDTSHGRFSIAAG